MKKYSHTILGVSIAVLIVSFITFGRVIWENNWRGLDSYIFLCIAVSVISGGLGLLIDAIKNKTKNK